MGTANPETRHGIMTAARFLSILSRTAIQRMSYFVRAKDLLTTGTVSTVLVLVLLPTQTVNNLFHSLLGGSRKPKFAAPTIYAVIEWKYYAFAIIADSRTK